MCRSSPHRRVPEGVLEQVAGGRVVAAAGAQLGAAHERHAAVGVRPELREQPLGLRELPLGGVEVTTEHVQRRELGQRRGDPPAVARRPGSARSRTRRGPPSPPARPRSRRSAHARTAPSRAATDPDRRPAPSASPLARSAIAGEHRDDRARSRRAAGGRAGRRRRAAPAHARSPRCGSAGGATPGSVQVTIASASMTSSGSVSPPAPSPARSQASASSRAPFSAQNHRRIVAIRSAVPPSPVSPRKRIAASTLSRSSRSRASQVSWSAPAEVRIGLGDQRREVRGVRPTQGRQLPGALGLLLGVLADRLEHPPARVAPAPLDPEQRAVHERRTAGRRRRVPRPRRRRRRPPPRRGVAPAGNTDSRRARRRSGSLSRSQLQSTTARRVRWRPAAARLPAGEQAEAVVQAVGELLERHRAQPRRGELDRERQAVDAAADVRHDRRRRLVEREVGRGRRGALREQAAPPPPPRSGPTGASASPPMPSGSRLVARIRRPRAAGEQAVGQLGRGDDDVLAVVEDEQRIAGAERIEQARLRIGGRCAPVGQRRLAQRRARRARRATSPSRVAERGQLHEPRRARRARRELEGEPRLARAARPDERDEPVASEQVAGALQVAPRGRRSSSARRAGCRAAAARRPRPRRTARCASCSSGDGIAPSSSSSAVRSSSYAASASAWRPASASARMRSAPSRSSSGCSAASSVELGDVLRGRTLRDRGGDEVDAAPRAAASSRRSASAAGSPRQSASASPEQRRRAPAGRPRAARAAPSRASRSKRSASTSSGPTASR